MIAAEFGVRVLNRGQISRARASVQFAERRVNRYSPGSAPEREQGYEHEYLLSEVSMSVFCTEILGFSNEVWERPPQPDADLARRLLPV